MAQTRVNGGAASDQFVTGTLNWYVLDEVDGSANVRLFGYNSGTAQAGEVALNAIATVANPVIVQAHASNARLMYFATEVAGASATDMANAVNGTASFANATVTAGTLSVS